MVTLVIGPDRLGGDRTTVEGDAYRHLFRSLRLRRDDRLRVVDGRGAARFARVAEVDRRSATLALEGAAPDGEPSRRVELAIAAVRPERAGWAVEKSTEIGVRAIHWFGCERSPRRYGTGQLERFRRVAVAAVEQSGRSWVPTIDALSWAELLALAGARETLLLDPRGGELPAAGGERGGLLVVGPEGGLTACEIGGLEDVGAVRWRLGPTILRTETAATVASGLLLCR
ncbi:MAG TPA: RsmE family RNA methyltransferase [Thermoanaerobaculia bacterium]|nr:RsmE family RNA methyltransferase [Thermoanaerobaculia bacterium]